jgi:hypothetical protein
MSRWKTYVAAITDSPASITSITFDSSHKSVLDYVGEYEGIPDAVKELEESVDQTVGAERWVGR